jgi:hypothetical protein
MEGVDDELLFEKVLFSRIIGNALPHTAILDVQH